MRYKVKTQECYLIVKAKASWGEQLDENALAAFADLSVHGFLTPRDIRKNAAEYVGPIGISLYERLQHSLSKREFLFIMEQIVAALQKIESHNLSINHVVLDLNYVFIHAVTKEIQFLYVPSSESVENPGVIPFVEAIIYSAKPAQEADTEFITRFNYFLKGNSTFDPAIVESYIANEDPSVVNTIKKQSLGHHGFMVNGPTSHYGPSEEMEHPLANRYSYAQGSEETDILNSVDAEAHSGMAGYAGATTTLNERLFEHHAAASENDWSESDQTVLLSEEEKGTVLLKELWAVRYPCLFRVRNQEHICINKPIFRIGKERGCVDYCVTNNNAISRSHAYIVTRENRYYVVDMNSKNNTYVNGQMVAPECETELRDGDHLKLANEEFSFRI